MEGWKYRSRELLKAIFCNQKKRIRKKTFSWYLHEFFFRHLHEKSQPSGQNQQNGKRTYCRLHTPQSFRINFKDTPSHIFIGVYILSRIFLNFFSNLYIAPWLQKISNSWCWDYWKVHLWVKKLNLFIFTYVPEQKSLLGSYHYPSRQEEITHFPHTTFFVFFLSRKGGELWSWKMTKIKLASVLVTSFDKFHHFGMKIP